MCENQKVNLQLDFLWLITLVLRSRSTFGEPNLHIVTLEMKIVLNQFSSAVLLSYWPMSVWNCMGYTIIKTLELWYYQITVQVQTQSIHQLPCEWFLPFHKFILTDPKINKVTYVFIADEKWKGYTDLFQFPVMMLSDNLYAICKCHSEFI